MGQYIDKSDKIAAKITKLSGSMEGSKFRNVNKNPWSLTKVTVNFTMADEEGRGGLDPSIYGDMIYEQPLILWFHFGHSRKFSFVFV